MAWPNVYDLDASKFEKSASSKPNKASIVLVHDAFHAPFHFERLRRILRDANYTVLVPQLPSSSATSRPRIFEEDVRAIYDVSKPEIDAGRNAVFVLHGYGAVPGSVAAEGLNRYALGRPRAGFVVKNIFISAMIANQGECILDLIQPGWLLHENNFLSVRKPDQVFFQDCSAEITRAALSMLSTQVADSFRFKVTHPGWAQIPCLYVICELDQAVLPAWQHSFVRKLQSSNAHTTVVSLQSGHAPFLSCINELVTLIVHASNGSRRGQ